MPTVIAKVSARLSTGNLVEGQAFECSAQDAERLKRMGWVRDQEKNHEVGAISTKTYQTRALKAEGPQAINRHPAIEKDEAEAAPEGVSEIASLRAEYETVIGRKPFNGWDRDTLRDKIAAYLRRDMRAEF